jgi:hypothetical protein
MPHPIVHAEIRSSDPDATREFCANLFGWSYSDGASGPFEARRTASFVAVILVNLRRSLAVRNYRARSPEVPERSAGPSSHPAAGIAHPPLTPNWPGPPNDQHDRSHPHRPCLPVRRPATVPSR